MKKTTVKIPAKINLTLDVGKKEGEFHKIESLVASCNLYDAITVSKRNDKNVTFKEKNILVGGNPEDNNAVKTARLFMQEYNTSGVDIVIEKNIPIGSGLGGSSADIAGVILAMRKLFGVTTDYFTFAEKLGSDVYYMTQNGGYGVMRGKGNDIMKIKVNRKMYGVLLVGKEQVNTAESYATFDSLGVEYEKATETCVDLLIKKDFKSLAEKMKNDLYLASVKVLPEMEDRINALKIQKGVAACLMTGSGSGVYAVFDKKHNAKKAYKNLKSIYGKNAYFIKLF